MSRKRIFLARIEMEMRNPKHGTKEVLDLIALDMWTLAPPEAKPAVSVKELEEKAWKTGRKTKRRSPA